MKHFDFVLNIEIDTREMLMFLKPRKKNATETLFCLEGDKKPRWPLSTPSTPVIPFILI